MGEVRTTSTFCVRAQLRSSSRQRLEGVAFLPRNRSILTTVCGLESRRLRDPTPIHASAAFAIFLCSFGDHDGDNGTTNTNRGRKSRVRDEAAQFWEDTVGPRKVAPSHRENGGEPCGHSLSRSLVLLGTVEHILEPTRYFVLALHIYSRAREHNHSVGEMVGCCRCIQKRALPWSNNSPSTIRPQGPIALYSTVPYCTLLYCAVRIISSYQSYQRTDGGASDQYRSVVAG